MTKNALVLGGGGTLGVAWETGLLAGLRDAGIDPGAADLVVGTSAGSIVGTYIAGGKLDEGIARQSQASDPDINAMIAEVDFVGMTQLFAYWASLPELTKEVMAEVGAKALAAKTTTEQNWTAYFEDLVPVEAWPSKPLMLTAVDTANGDFQVWDRDSGIPIHLAVASSCAVPGMFPPVTLNGKRYTDGGVRSGTSADLAAGFDSVLMVAPIGSGKDGIDPILGRTSRAEAETLRTAGSHVELAFPDADSLEAMGGNRMDSSRRPQCIEAGRRQGTSLAATLSGMWVAAAV
jgi:NTE family protein